MCRETYVGPWLPDPVDTSADPYLGAERDEALDFAALPLLEKLGPHERAAYVLREAFDYPYGRIAGILRLTEPAVRQLVSRARKRLEGDRRTPVPAAARKELLTRLLAAARSGDLAGLERLFAADAQSVSDGNGAHRVSRRPVVGAVRIARFLTTGETEQRADMRPSGSRGAGRRTRVSRARHAPPHDPRHAARPLDPTAPALCTEPHRPRRPSQPSRLPR